MNATLTQTAQTLKDHITVTVKVDFLEMEKIVQVWNLFSFRMLG